VITLLDNTILSNFALIHRVDLIRLALGEAATVEEAFAEHQAGVRLERIPASDWSWLTVLQLVGSERAEYERLRIFLNAGEAACLAVAGARGYRVFTDDRDARELAIQMQIPISGTLGILIRLVEQNQVSLTDANRHLKDMIAAGYRSPVSSLDALLSER
jgi:predicted nucleic acid-binding protein